MDINKIKLESEITDLILDVADIIADRSDLQSYANATAQKIIKMVEADNVNNGKGKYAKN